MRPVRIRVWQGTAGFSRNCGEKPAVFVGRMNELLDNHELPPIITEFVVRVSDRRRLPFVGLFDGAWQHDHFAGQCVYPGKFRRDDGRIEVRS